MTRRFTLAMCLLAGPMIAAADEIGAGPAAARIDALLEAHWRAQEIRPASLTDDGMFLRRITLDLAGRIPTYDEARAFTGGPGEVSGSRRQQLVRRLMQSAEYHLQLSVVLDQIIQEKYAGEREFREYLRASVKSGKPWSAIFREILLGPWDTPEKERSSRFVSRRLRNVDELATDTARVFFGVNVSCAKCHDHPLVLDWTQDHYYGMVAFFKRTYEHRDGNKRIVGEKSDGEVSFVARDGKKKTAKMKFLSGLVLAEPQPRQEKTDDGKKDTSKKKARQKTTGPYTPPAFSRRERLVEVALENKVFFSRALVNRLWAYFMGRGLVEPVDQMHSENPPSIPGLLEWLAEDFVASGYDIHRLVHGIVSSRAYGLASIWEREGEPPDDEHFAMAPVKPLSPAQYAASLLLASGKDALGGGGTDLEDETYEQQEKGALELARRAESLTGHRAFDAPSADFQSSATEALYMSNHPAVQQLVEPRAGHLVETLSTFSDTGELIDAGYWVILGRPPAAEERAYLVDWLEQGGKSRTEAVRDLSWALFTSTEFRFNH